MTVRRGTILLLVFTTLALSVVYLRAEQTRTAASILRMESEWVRLRSDLWKVQTRLARARAPNRIHDRAIYLATGLIPPGAQERTSDEVERVAVQVLPPEKSFTDGRNPRGHSSRSE